MFTPRFGISLTPDSLSRHLIEAFLRITENPARRIPEAARRLPSGLAGVLSWPRLAVRAGTRIAFRT